MSVRPAPEREDQTQTDDYEPPFLDNDFWDRMGRVEDLLVEARELLEDIKEGFDAGTRRS